MPPARRPAPTSRTAVTTSDVAGKTFTVNSTADTVDAAKGNGVCADASGRCTLRAALAEADYLKGDDRIEFNLSGTAPVTIQLASRLPYITSRNGTVTIDGYSQPGSSVNTAEFGSNAVPGVEIRGNGGSAKEVGLIITSPGNTVRGLLMDNLYRGIMLDGVDAHDNRIIGNEIGFTRTGANASGQNFAVVHQHGRQPQLHRHAHPRQPQRHRQLRPCHRELRRRHRRQRHPEQRPVHRADRCPGSLLDGHRPQLRPQERPHRWRRPVRAQRHRPHVSPGHRVLPRLEPRPAATHRQQPAPTRSTTTPSSATGSASRWTAATTRTTARASTSRPADNGQGINVYDGSNNNSILRNYVAATYDGIQVMAPNATGNIIKGNIIGVAPNGDAAPLTGWGIKIRWEATHETISGNTIRNAALGGIGLVQNTVYNIRISRNIISDTNGPAIYLAPTSGSTTKGANNLQAAPSSRPRPPTPCAARASRAPWWRSIGPTGRPVSRDCRCEFLGDATVASDGTWKVAISGVNAGQQVTSLQIRTDDNTSALGNNVDVTQAAVPPKSGDVILSDDFGRTLAGSWGTVDQGGAWALTGTAADFSVDGAAGKVSVAAASTHEARVAVGSTPDVEVTGSVALDQVPTGTNAYAYVLARASGNNAYRAAIRVATTGAVYVQLKKSVSNVESNVGSEVAVGTTITAGSPIGFRFRVVGSTLSFRAWNASGAEPAAWTVTGSDSTAALAGAGGVGLRTYAGSALTNGPVIVSLDALRVLVP